MHIVYFCEKLTDCHPPVVESCASLTESLDFMGLEAEKFHRKWRKNAIFFTYFYILGIKKLLKYGKSLLQNLQFLDKMAVSSNQFI